MGNKKVVRHEDGTENKARLEKFPEKRTRKILHIE
jgi:hypothetical protein